MNCERTIADDFVTGRGTQKVKTYFGSTKGNYDLAGLHCFLLVLIIVIDFDDFCAGNFGELCDECNVAFFAIIEDMRGYVLHRCISGQSSFICSADLPSSKRPARFGIDR